MKSFVALVAAVLLASPVARSDILDGDQTLRPESVEVTLPENASANEDTAIFLKIALPSGCHQTEVAVEHRDDFVHVITPRVVTVFDSDCLPVANSEFQVVSLGKLLPGEHDIFVENTLFPTEVRRLSVDAERRVDGVAH